MANVVFSAQKRTVFGSAATRRLRHSGRVPGVIYGQGETLNVELDARSFTQGIKRATESTIVKIELDGKSHEAFVKDTQRNIMTGDILHVDFYEIETDKILRTRVSLHIHGNPVGVRDGGVLETPLHEVEVECLPRDLPERIEVDISNLKANQAIHVRDLQLGSGVKLVSAGDQVIAVVKFAKADAAPAEDTAAAAASDAKDGKA
ncbi:MAG: 50S ribosomal protein L25 [Spirochaetaceae bacterium]|jgi:large subunit ribosomal protein L25|nr:50S ribosomal protein L25 [Spirochaetaceae bacterium]